MPKEVCQSTFKILLNPEMSLKNNQRLAKFHQGGKFRQIWSHWLKEMEAALAQVVSCCAYDKSK